MSAAAQLLWPMVALAGLVGVYRLVARWLDRPAELAKSLGALEAKVADLANRVQAAQLRGEQLKELGDVVDRLSVEVGLARE